jgi:hypothetical protein
LEAPPVEPPPVEAPLVRVRTGALAEPVEGAAAPVLAPLVRVRGGEAPTGATTALACDPLAPVRGADLTAAAPPATDAGSPAALLAPAPRPRGGRSWRTM